MFCAPSLPVHVLANDVGHDAEAEVDASELFLRDRLTVPTELRDHDFVRDRTGALRVELEATVDDLEATVDDPEERGGFEYYHGPE